MWVVGCLILTNEHVLYIPFFLSLSLANNSPSPIPLNHHISRIPHKVWIPPFLPSLPPSLQILSCYLWHMTYSHEVNLSNLSDITSQLLLHPPITPAPFPITLISLFFFSSSSLTIIDHPSIEYHPKPQTLFLCFPTHLFFSRSSLIFSISFSYFNFSFNGVNATAILICTWNI